MEDDDDQKELQLLPAPHSTASSSNVPSALSGSSSRRRSAASDPYELAPSLDLQLSISLPPDPPPTNGCAVSGGPAREYGGHAKPETNNVRALKWEAAEQIRLAAIEKAYAERVRELTRREMELAQSEFARARHMWERAREEVDRAERMKERATRQIDSACMEITCQSCRQRFRPA